MLQWVPPTKAPLCQGSMGKSPVLFVWLSTFTNVLVSVLGCFVPLQQSTWNWAIYSGTEIHFLTVVGLRKSKVRTLTFTLGRWLNW